MEKVEQIVDGKNIEVNEVVEKDDEIKEVVLDNYLEILTDLGNLYDKVKSITQEHLDFRKKMISIEMTECERIMSERNQSSDENSENNEQI